MAKSARLTVQERPKGATPRLRSGAAAGRSRSTSEDRGGSPEEPPHARGQGQLPGRATHVQGAVAALAQEGLEGPSHVEGQEGWQ